MHQLRMRLLKPFWGWTKTHLPLPRVFGFFSPFSAPKFFPPTYLPPPTYLLLTYLPLPTHLVSFCVHSIAKAWERLEREPWQRLGVLEAGSRRELEGKLPSLALLVVLLQQKRQRQQSCHRLLFFVYFGFATTKKAMAQSYCHLLLFWFCCNKEGNNSRAIVTFFFSFWFCFNKQGMITLLS